MFVIVVEKVVVNDKVVEAETVDVVDASVGVNVEVAVAVLVVAMWADLDRGRG